MVLQKDMDLLKGETDLCNETYIPVSCDGNQVIDIKVEDVLDIKQEKDPDSISSPDITTEHEVSFIAVSPVNSIAVVKKQVGKSASTAYTASTVIMFLHHSNFQFLLDSGTKLIARIV